jgi:4-carboxymuconolactone decarboxylase
VSPEQEELLRRLSLGDEGVTGSALRATVAPSAGSSLDPAALALTRVAALIATEAALASYQWAVESALAAGASDTDIVDVLIAVAPVVGLARVAAAAPELALALGYDVESPSGR